MRGSAPNRTSSLCSLKAASWRPSKRPANRGPSSALSRFSPSPMSSSFEASGPLTTLLSRVQPMSRRVKTEKQDSKDEGKLKGKEYERELERLHVELVKLQEWVKHKGLK